MENSFRKIHFVGVGGTGTGTFAVALSENGYQVSGSDKVLYEPRYNRAVTDAMMAAYPQQRVLGEYHLHFPKGALPPEADAMSSVGNCAAAR